MTAIILPDVLELTRSYLITCDAVTALVPVARIATRSPQSTTTPWVRIWRIGGLSPDYRRIDAATIQVDAFSPGDERKAMTIARTVRGYLHDAPGFSDGVGVITAVLDQSGLINQDDASRTPPTPRVLFGVTVYARPV